MKKIFFFLFTVILFASCSNSNDDVTLVDNGKKYKVTLDVINKFVVESGALKSTETNWPYNYICEYTIYKEDGTVVDHEVLNEPQLQFELSKGNYKIAVLAARNTEYMGNSYLEHSNLATDYCNGNHWIAKSADNAGMYFEIIDFTVNESVNNVTSIELKPMWSEIDVEVTDAATCTIPEGTTGIFIGVEPYYSGFAIKDKIPTKKLDMYPIALASMGQSISEFRKGGALPSCYIAQSKNVTVKLIYRSETATETKIVGERVIYQGDFESGKRYKFSGKVGNDNGVKSFNVSLGSLTDVDPIPFE